MNIATRTRNYLKRFLVGPPSANTIDLLDRFIITGWLSSLSKAGVEVNTQTAQTLTAVYRAVELLSTVVPSPSCPDPLAPQVQSVPSLATPAVEPTVVPTLTHVISAPT